MRGVAGSLMLALGLGVAAYAYYPTSSGVEGMADLALSAAPAVEAQGPPPVNRVFSPQSPLFSPVAAALRPASPVSAKPVGAVVEAAVTTIPGNKPGVSKPATPEARVELIRGLQRELKRVGCYDGEIDGSWGGGSKRAMGQFTERVNATLPMDEPDYILLTLVQSHKAAACGATCPPAQSMIDGRCVPKPVLASRKPVPKVDTSVTVAAAPTSAMPPPPVAEAPKQQVPIAVPAPPPSTPQTIARVEARPPVEPRVAVEPLPGRMAIGGPLAHRPAEVSPSVTEPSSTTAHAPIHKSAPARQIRTAPPRPAAVHAPAPRREARPTAPVRVAAPAYAPSSNAASRQRSLTYNLFQRPDRTGN